MTQPERTTPTLQHTRTEPVPATTEAETQAPPKHERLNPTRYGDWELNGKCVDF